MLSNMKIPVISGLILILICGACSTTQSVFNGRIKPMTTEELDTEIRKQEIVFETFAAKAKVDVSSLSSTNSFSVSMAVRSDSMIGLSLRMLGIEGARVRITPDSIEILDRINQEYIPRPISFLKDSLLVDLDYSGLQDLLTGNPIMYDSASLTQEESEAYYILHARNGVYKNTLSLDEGIAIVRMFILDLQTQRSLDMHLGAYEKTAGRRFAMNRQILIHASGDLQANIEFTEVVFDEPFSFSFSVNPKYTRVD